MAYGLMVCDGQYQGFILPNSLSLPDHREDEDAHESNDFIVLQVWLRKGI